MKEAGSVARIIEVMENQDMFSFQGTSNQIVGVDCDEGPPVPIPNTEVKLVCADDSCRVTGCENR